MNNIICTELTERLCLMLNVRKLCRILWLFNEMVEPFFKANTSVDLLVSVSVQG